MTDWTLSAAELDALELRPSVIVRGTHPAQMKAEVHITDDERYALVAQARRTEAAERKLAAVTAAYRAWTDCQLSFSAVLERIRRALQEG